MNIPKRLNLPDPTAVRQYIPRQLYHHLARMNSEIQDLCSKLRSTLVAGSSGTLIVDDGTNRVTIVFFEGNPKTITTAASSGQTMSWTAT